MPLSIVTSLCDMEANMDAGGEDIQKTSTTRSSEEPTATAARLKGVVPLEDRAGVVRRVMVAFCALREDR